MHRPYEAPSPLLVGYDPYIDLPQDHLARLVELVVEDSIVVKEEDTHPGQPKFDPRLCLKVLVYGYATGVRSSRQLEKQCNESLPYLFLTRGDTPSYRTLCSFRTDCRDMLEKVWLGLFGVAKGLGLKRLGRIVVDSTKLRANASTEMILDRKEYAAVKQELQRILDEAEGVKAVDGDSGYFKSESVASLIRRGIDTCIPASITSCELHRGMAVGSLVKRSSVPLEYDADRDVYLCPEGNVLTLRPPKKGDGESIKRYQCIRKCAGCTRYNECIVRSDGKPAKLMTTGYQLRRLHSHWAKGIA